MVGFVPFSLGGEPGVKRGGELVVILRVAPYVGEDTWVLIGGDHLKERTKNSLLQEGENKVMYAIVHLKGGQVTTDWGYSSAKEAEAVSRSAHPGVPIVKS